ncbi:MAG: hypothetical protein WCE61_09385 [Candidatus Acidiferrum sp.]
MQILPLLFSLRALSFSHYTCLDGRLSAVALPAQTAPAGVVLQSSDERLNAADASVGTTLYDGDRLETQQQGALSVRSGQIQLSLSDDTILWMNHENSVLTPTLQSGTVLFQAQRGAQFEIRADDIRVRPHGTALTIGQVTLEKCDVLVTARSQSLDVTAGEETKTIEEGKTYRVARVNACGAAQYHPPLAGGSSRFYMMAGAVVGVVTKVAVIKALESPDKP